MKYSFKKDNWAVPINRESLWKTGIYEHLRLVPIFQHMLIQANKQGEMEFTFQYASDLFGIGFPKYNAYLDDLEKLGLIEILVKNSKDATKIKIVNYYNIMGYPKKSKKYGTL